VAIKVVRQPKIVKLGKFYFPDNAENLELAEKILKHLNVDRSSPYFKERQCVGTTREIQCVANCFEPVCDNRPVPEYDMTALVNDDKVVVSVIADRVSKPSKEPEQLGVYRG